MIRNMYVNLQFRMLAQRKKMIFEVFRTFNTTSSIGASHYDILGITPKATQSDIKTAYYKLSKQHHPDKSKDAESAEQFRLITEAYEVLGNIKLKKMYDKGLLVDRGSISQTNYKPDEEPTDPSLKFYKSRNLKNIVPTMDGKTPIYDYDTWSKEHYGNLLKRTIEHKDYIKKRKEKQISHVHSYNQQFGLVFMYFIGAVFITLIIYGKTDYDIIQTPEQNKCVLPQVNNKLENSKSNS